MNRIWMTKRSVLEFVFAILGIISASIGLKAFLLPNHFLDGGATGVSLLVSRLLGYNISVVIILVNLPFIFLGYKQISPAFAVKSFLSILSLAIIVHLIKIPVITRDNTLISFFGGVFLGAGAGLSVRGGTVVDGTEIIALFISKRLRISIGSITLVFNIFLFCVAALLSNVEIALYSMLTYITSAKSADFIIHGIDEYIGITIVSIKSEQIRVAITEELGCGATIYKGKRGFRINEVQDVDLDIIHTVTTRLERGHLYKIIEQIDDKAFIIEYNLNNTKGGITKKISK